MPPTNEERIARAEKLLDKVSKQLDSPDSANVREILDLIKHDADNQHQMNVDMADAHTRHAEEVVASIAALKTMQVDEVELVKALGNF